MFGFKKNKKSYDGAPGDTWLFVGLGNPGNQHKNNRHNIGFMAVDRIASDYRFPAEKSKYKGLLSENKIDGRKVVILKPQTYMNVSGEAVQAAASFYKVEPAQIVVFYDEIELPPGKLRVKRGGGHAGHNGLRSLDACLPSNDYWRVRLGVGRPEHGDVSGHVLGNFGKTDQVWLDKMLESVSRHFGMLMQGKDSEFMNKVTLDTREQSAGAN
jgi:peptidyl-tRNA hydrolase, PTH1 family